MDKKFLVSLLLIMVLLSQTAFAAFTVTWVTPASGSTYTNNAMNRTTIDLNFTIVDDNSAIGKDVNLSIVYYGSNTLPSTATTIIASTDWNILSQTSSTYICSKDTWAAGKKCRYTWNIPINTTMSDGTYWIDVNVYSYARDAIASNLYDTNATLEIGISNKMSNIAQLRSMLGTIVVILAVAALLAIAGMGIVLKPNPVEFVRNSFLIGIIVVAIGIVIGIIVTLM